MRWLLFPYDIRKVVGNMWMKMGRKRGKQANHLQFSTLSLTGINAVLLLTRDNCDIDFDGPQNTEHSIVVRHLRRVVVVVNKFDKNKHRSKADTRTKLA
jgi:hypothetical protein